MQVSGYKPVTLRAEVRHLTAVVLAPSIGPQVLDATRLTDWTCDMQFEWDWRKATANLRKHRVAFDNAIAVFADPLARIFTDPDHSEAEERELVVGYDATDHLLIVSFVERNGNVRIISARHATAKETHAHETHIR